MFEFAAFGFVTLVWWTWPAIAGIVIASMWLVLLAHDRQDRKREADSGPYPCLVHLGVDVEGSHSWCGQPEGHDGPHGGWAIDALRWQSTEGEQPYKGVSVCLRSSDCYQPANHDGACLLQYGDAPYEGDGYQQNNE
jgi:hypothetical protein